MLKFQCYALLLQGRAVEEIQKYFDFAIYGMKPEENLEYSELLLKWVHDDLEFFRVIQKNIRGEFDDSRVENR